MREAIARPQISSLPPPHPHSPLFTSTSPQLRQPIGNTQEPGRKVSNCSHTPVQGPVEHHGPGGRVWLEGGRVWLAGGVWLAGVWVGLKGLRVLGPRSPGFLKLPCRKQREQGSTDHPVEWQEPLSLPHPHPHPSLCRTQPRGEILDPSPSWRGVLCTPETRKPKVLRDTHTLHIVFLLPLHIPVPQIDWQGACGNC